MRPFSDIFTQGGQTQLHKLHMMQQVFGTTLKISLLLSFLFFMGLLYWNYTSEHLCFLASFYKANLRVEFDFLPKGFFDTSWVSFNGGNWREVDDDALVNHPNYIKLAYSIQLEVFKSLLQSAYFFIISMIILSCYWGSRGFKRQKTQILKGYELVTPKALKRKVKKMGGSPIEIGLIPLPLNAECEHMMITGTTGAGKTNAIYSLLKQIRALGHKVIIIDTNTGFTSRFFDAEKDKLINPFDARTKNWDLWKEFQEEYDFDEFSESLIPGESYDKFWTKAAQQLFSTAAFQMKKNNTPNIQNLLEDLLSKSIQDIYKLFSGTLVSAYVDPANEKTALGIRATLVSALRNLKYLEGSGEPFSIREWLMDDKQKGWLFLSSLPTQREALKPLLSAWLSIAVKGLMSLGENRDRRVWFIIDELASLNRIPALLQGLAETRRYGGCFVLGFQDLYQLDTIYGNQTVRTLGALTGTKIVFRVDSHGAKQISELFGEQETREFNESISFGAHQMRDGVSLTDQQKIRPLISSADIMKLNNFEAYLKFPRNLPVAKIKFDFQNLSEVALPFVYKKQSSEEIKSVGEPLDNEPQTLKEEIQKNEGKIYSHSKLKEVE